MISHTNIWSVETAGASAGKPRELISHTRLDTAPDFSPFGRKIAFESTRSGSWEIWVCDADGSNPVPLPAFGGPTVGSPRWSPDGNQIAFDSLAAGNWDVYVVSAAGGKPKPLTTSPWADTVPSWSRDGRWVYFASNRGGDDQVWKIPAGGGKAIPVTQNGGYTALESSDGKTLFFMKGRESGPLFRLPLEGGAESQVLDSVHGRAFAVAERGIYFISSPDETGRKLLQFLDFAGGKIREIAAFSQTGHGRLTVSPDGLTVLFGQSDVGGIDLMLVENFR